MPTILHSVHMILVVVTVTHFSHVIVLSSAPNYSWESQIICSFHPYLIKMLLLILNLQTVFVVYLSYNG